MKLELCYFVNWYFIQFILLLKMHDTTSFSYFLEILTKLVTDSLKQKDCLLIRDNPIVLLADIDISEASFSLSQCLQSDC